MLLCPPGERERWRNVYILIYLSPFLDSSETPEKITPTTAPSILHNGNKADIFCLVTSTVECSYELWKDDIKLATGRKSKDIPFIYTIDDVQFFHEGNYSCNAFCLTTTHSIRKYFDVKGTKHSKIQCINPLVGAQVWTPLVYSIFFYCTIINCLLFAGVMLW